MCTLHFDAATAVLNMCAAATLSSQLYRAIEPGHKSPLKKHRWLVGHFCAARKKAKKAMKKGQKAYDSPVAGVSRDGRLWP